MSWVTRPGNPALRPGEWPLTVAAIRGVLRASVLRLETDVLPPDDPRVRNHRAARIDACFYFSRDLSPPEAWQAVERGLASLLNVQERTPVDSRTAPSGRAAEQSGKMCRYYVKRLNALLDAWRLPHLPSRLPVSANAPALSEVQMQIRTEIRRQPDGAGKARLQRAALGWLFETVKLNVKRQRGYFELGQVLQGYANCLGYAKLFRGLAPGFGLDCGIVEVIEDNVGRLSPHQANIFRIADGTWQLVDAWYGSTDIKHSRLGLRVKERGRWRTKDEDAIDLEPGTPVAGLCRQEIDALTFYIRGNRLLADGKPALAIECYNAANRLYPTDPRPLFNRAVAWEQLGEKDKAAADYTRALKDEAAMARVLATEHDEVTRLIELDSRGVGQRDQQVFLLRKGFVTGEIMAESGVAARTGLSVEEVRRIVERIDVLVR